MVTDNLIQPLHELDAQALSEIHDEYFPRLYRYAHQRLSDQYQAEDTASEVFIRLVEAIHNGNGPRRNITGWLFQTASNVISDYYRSQYRHPVEPLDEDLLSPNKPPEETLAGDLDDPMLRQAMNSLTSPQQDVLALRFSAGLNLEETAQAMNKSINAVKALQFRAIASLRELVGE